MASSTRCSTRALSTTWLADNLLDGSYIPRQKNRNPNSLNLLSQQSGDSHFKRIFCSRPSWKASLDLLQNCHPHLINRQKQLVGRNRFKLFFHFQLMKAKQHSKSLKRL